MNDISSGDGAANVSAVNAALDNPLTAPLREVLGHDLQEAGIARMWSRISTNEVDHQEAWFERLGFRRPVYLLLVASFLAGYLLVFRFPSEGPLLIEGQGEISGALNSAAAGTRRKPSHVGAQNIHLRDGSRIGVFGEAELAVLSNDSDTFVTSLRSGKVEFYVKPGGPRRWLIEAGAVSVEVVGTHFVVERSTRGTIVSVKKGVVLVRGNVPSGELRLTAGQSVTALPRTVVDSEVQALEIQSKQSAPVVEAAEPQHAESAPQTPPLERATTLAELPFEEEETRIAQTTEKEALGTIGSRPEEEKIHADEKVDADKKVHEAEKLDRIEQMLQEADAARAAGRTAEAARLFSQVVTRAGPGDVRRGIAALSFARVSSDPSAVLKVLRKGMHSIPAGLREPALARMVRAHSQLGELSQTKRMASIYLSEFPDGPRADLVKNWAAF